MHPLVCRAGVGVRPAGHSVGRGPCRLGRISSATRVPESPSRAPPSHPQPLLQDSRSRLLCKAVFVHCCFQQRFLSRALHLPASSQLSQKVLLFCYSNHHSSEGAGGGGWGSPPPGSRAWHSGAQPSAFVCGDGRGGRGGAQPGWGPRQTLAEVPLNLVSQLTAEP